MSDALEGLRAEAQKVDAENGVGAAAEVAAPPGEQPEAAPPVDEAKELAALLQVLAMMIAPIYPSIGKIYTTAQCEQIGQAALPVMVKRGWSVSSALGKYAEELALCAVLLPVGVATYQGVTADIAAAEKAKADKPEAAAVEAVASAVPVPGVDKSSPKLAERG